MASKRKEEDGPKSKHAMNNDEIFPCRTMAIVRVVSKCRVDLFGSPIKKKQKGA